MPAGPSRGSTQTSLWGGNVILPYLRAPVSFKRLLGRRSPKHCNASRLPLRTGGTGLTSTVYRKPRNDSRNDVRAPHGTTGQGVTLHVPVQLADWTVDRHWNEPVQVDRVGSKEAAI